MIVEPRNKPVTREADHASAMMEDLPGNSLFVDAILPEKEVRSGDSWKLDGAAAAKLLGLDAVARSEVPTRPMVANSSEAACGELPKDFT